MLTLFCFYLLSTTLACHLQPYFLRTEGKVNPFVDQSAPSFSWKLQDALPNQYQLSYRIRCSSSSGGPPDLWDSQDVKSNSSVYILYGGVNLTTRQKVYWSVEIQAIDGSKCMSKETAWFETTLLNGFSSQWITAGRGVPGYMCDFYKNTSAELFRQTFSYSSSSPLARARLYVTGLGYYEAYIEGQRIGDAWLDPGPSNYELMTYYRSYDITELLLKNNNQTRHTIGVILGNGWFNPLPMLFWGNLNLRESLPVGEPCLIAEIYLEFADGTAQVISTDHTWKIGNSSIIHNDIYLGVIEDARLDQGCWSCLDFDDSKWPPAHILKSWNPPLQLAPVSPIILGIEYVPVSISRPDPKNPKLYLVDIGKNIAGVINITGLKGPAGSVVTIRYGEILFPNGSLNVLTSVAGQIKAPGVGGPCAPDVAYQRDVYILAGRPEGESFIPHFTWHGFQFVEIDFSQVSVNLTESMLRAYAVHTDVESVGTFESSNKLLNDIQEMFHLTLLNNLQGSQSDCPHRERFGYGGDLLATAESGILNYDMTTLYALRLAEYTRDAVKGVFTETSPDAGMHDAGVGRLGGPIGWGSVQPQLAVRLYRHYGDLPSVRLAYHPALAYVRILEEHMDQVRNGLSDWNGIEVSPIPLTGLGFLYSNMRAVSFMAQLLNDSHTEREYSDRADALAISINREFLNETTGVYAGINADKRNWSATQCAQGMALFLGLPSEASESLVLQRLIDNIEEKGNHLATGMFGIRWMLLSLCDRGACDKAYSMIAQRSYPSYGYMLASNATSMWESWDYSNNSQSHNHPMFGSVSQFFFSSLAGIRPAPNAVAFSPLLVAPNFVRNLTYVKATYDSIRGPIAVSWTCDKLHQECTLSANTPPNVEAIVQVPSLKVSCEVCAGWTSSTCARDSCFTGNGLLTLKFSPHQ